MAVCINKNLREYQALKDMSGIPEIVLDYYCSQFLDKFDRLPELDELPNVNSEGYLRNAIKVAPIGDIDFADNAAIAENVGVSPEEATVKINSIYKDLEVKVTPTSEQRSMIEVRHRPSQFADGEEEIDGNFVPNKENQRVIIRQALDRMRTLYGIQITELNSDELKESGILQQIPEAAMARAFVYNGQIVVNSDLADLDAPVHEMLHIFLGAMRFTNPVAYQNILDRVSRFHAVERLAKVYPNRTTNDLLEEVLVSEMGNLLVGKASELNYLTTKDLNLMLYEIQRNLDTMLMGNISVKSLDFEEVASSTLLSLAAKTQSPEFNEVNISVMDLSDMHRRTANVKQKLMESGELEEICE
jgi:hypothetical protein